MIKKILLPFVLILTVFIKATSQECFPQGVAFGTQNQIDSFAINHPECVRILGGVEVRENKPGGITNLNGLSQISSIGGQLKLINNTSIKNFTGLENLTTIDGCLMVQVNNSLVDFKGLENLTAIKGCLNVYNNASLENLESLANLDSIGRYLKIQNNASLKNLSGLDQMGSIGGYTLIKNNPSLLDADTNEEYHLKNNRGSSKYDTWAYSLNNTLIHRGDLIAVKDSSISLLVSSKKLWAGPSVRNINAENIGALQFRKKGKVRNGVLIGAFSGLIAGGIWAANIGTENESDITGLSEAVNGMARAMAIMSGIGVGTLVGGLVSSARIKIPINGKQGAFAKNKREVTKYIIVN